MQQYLLGNLKDTAWLFLFTGLMILYLEPRTYGESRWKKEKRTSVILAWINLTLAVLVFVATFFVRAEG